MTRIGRTGEDQGSATVEFALVLPVLMVLLFGIIDFGRMMNARIVVSEAAREGARAAALGLSEEQVQDRVDMVLGSLGGTTVQDGSCDGSSRGDVEVTVTDRFSFVTPVFGDGMDLTASAVFACM